MINHILVLQPLLTCFGFPRWLSGKEYTCQCRRCKRCRFDPRVETTLWRREWQPTLVFSPGESPRTEEPEGLQSIGLLERVRYNWGTEHACLHVFLQHELDMSSWCSGVGPCLLNERLESGWETHYMHATTFPSLLMADITNRWAQAHGLSQSRASANMLNQLC